jgi:hypothetical protein
MSPIRFWKSWRKTDRITFGICSIVVLLSIIFFWQSWLAAPAPVISYNHFQQVQEVESTAHTFQVGLMNLSVPVDSYVIFEYIFGSRLQPNVFAAYLFLVALSISVLFFITIISTLSRLWFLIGMGLAILFLASLRLESLEVFGLTSKTITIALVLLFGGLAYYFHSIRKETTFAWRLFGFLGLIITIGILINFFSKANVPFLHLSASGLIAGIILSLIFIMMVSHEIIAAFVTITTQRTKSAKSLRHFLVLTIAYLINLALMFASKIGFVDWRFFTINSFFVLTISALLGIWGFRQRSPVYEPILRSEPIGLFFYCSMMLTAFASLGYFAASASDAMMDAFDDLIMAAHIGGGIIFALYVIANFAPMLVKNLPVYKVLYKPGTMPHFTFRLMSVIASFAVLSTATYWKTSVNQVAASYYHAYGDLYLVQGDDLTAEAYYLKSLQFRDQNLHAHYALASIYAGRYDSFKERSEYEKAKDWTPSVPLYLNLSASYANHEDLLEAALTLDEGKKAFPKSGELSNAIGLSFLRLKLGDSALYFFNRARNSKSTKREGQTNYLGASALFKVNSDVDSLISFGDTMTNAIKVNALALANMRHQVVLFEGKFKPDSSLSVYQASFLCNYFINQKDKTDTSLINLALKLARKSVNDDFKEQLLIACARTLYDHGQVKSALETIRGVSYTARDGKVFSLMALWLLEQNNPLLAASYFKMAAEKRHPLALYHQALAETESDSLAHALEIWDSLSHTKNSNVAEFAAMMKKVLAGSPSLAMSMNDEEKYYFCRYKISLEDSTTFVKILNTIADPNLRARAQLDRAKKWFAIDEADRSLNQLRQIKAASTKLKFEMEQLALILAAGKKNFNFIIDKLSNGLRMPADLRIYLEATLAERNGDQKTARAKYEYLVKANDQFEEGIVAASHYLARDSTDRLRNFSLLVDGLLAKPNSVKIVKQHVLESIALGFEQEAQDSLDKLQRLIPAHSFRKFIDAHPDYFSVERK